MLSHRVRRTRTDAATTAVLVGPACDVSLICILDSHCHGVPNSDPINAQLAGSAAQSPDVERQIIERVAHELTFNSKAHQKKARQSFPFESEGRSVFPLANRSA